MFSENRWQEYLDDLSKADPGMVLRFTWALAWGDLHLSKEGMSSFSNGVCKKCRQLLLGQEMAHFTPSQQLACGNRSPLFSCLC